MANSSLWSILLVGLAGCYSYSPVEVHVIDAQTTHPLSGISVAADYPRFMEFFPPKFDHAVTGADGVVVLSVCTNYSKAGNTVWIRLPYDTPYFLDQQTPASSVEIQAADIRKVNGSPYRIDLALMSVEEYRRRYPSK